MDLRWVVWENRPVKILKDYYWDKNTFFPERICFKTVKTKKTSRLNKACLFWRGPKCLVLEHISKALNKAIFLRMLIKT